ncbi:MAG TPA: hypothetical protein VF849_01850 [Blattabacteriaceae bacterium]
MSEIKQLNRVSTQIRRDILRSNSGHTVWALVCVEYFIAMYWQVLRQNPNIFCMKGVFLHIYPVYYSALIGFFSIRELNRKLKASCAIRGQGSVGASLAKKLNQYSLHGLNEGKIWEAAVIDIAYRNGINDRTVKEKFFGWEVIEELQAHDISCVINSWEIAKKSKGKPILIVLYTKMVGGCSFYQSL